MDQGILSLLAIGYYINPRSLEAFEIQMLVQVTYSMTQEWKEEVKEQDAVTNSRTHGYNCWVYLTGQYHRFSTFTFTMHPTSSKIHTKTT